MNEKQVISAGDVGEMPRGVARGSLTVRSAEEPAPLEDGRPAYEMESPTGEKILTREEVAAKLEAESMATVNLFREDGQPLRTIRIDPTYATRIINFEGRRYERIEGSDDWQEAGKEQPLKTQA